MICVGSLVTILFMADRNIRNFPAELTAALKAEAKTLGKGLDEYCIEILASRKSLKQNSEPLLPAGKSPAPGGALLDAFHAARDTKTGEVIKQEPAPIVGDWDAPAAEAGPGELPAPPPPPAAPVKRGCPHGWMNSRLCPQCRAIL